MFSHRSMCVASHSLLPVATPRSVFIVLSSGDMEGGDDPACYQRACWMVNTKSLTCDLLDGRLGRTREGVCVHGGGVCMDCLERRFP